MTASEKILEWAAKKVGHTDFLIVWRPDACKMGIYDLRADSFLGAVVWDDMTLEQCVEKIICDLS